MLSSTMLRTAAMLAMFASAVLGQATTDYFLWPPPESPGSPTIVWNAGFTYNISWVTDFLNMSLQIVSAYVDGDANSRSFTLLNGTDAKTQDGFYNINIPSTFTNIGSNLWNVLILNGTLIPINDTIYTGDINKFRSGDIVINPTTSGTSVTSTITSTSTSSSATGSITAVTVVTLTGDGSPVNTDTSSIPMSTPTGGSGDAESSSSGLSHSAVVGIGVGVGLGVPFIIGLTAALIWFLRRRNGIGGAAPAGGKVAGQGNPTGTSRYGISYNDEASRHPEMSSPRT